MAKKTITIDDVKAALVADLKVLYTKQLAVVTKAKKANNLFTDVLFDVGSMKTVNLYYKFNDQQEEKN